MKIKKYDNYSIIEDVKDFDIGQTLECGQCFHFNKIDDNEYAFVSFNNLFAVKQKNEEIMINTTDDKKIKVLMDYLDLNTNYGHIKKELIKRDDLLREAIEANWGIHILNQEFSETLMSFIISQNKQIPHIRKIVKGLSERFGEFLGSINGVDYYSFPDIDQISNISVDDYKELKTGFRAPYLKDASDKLVYYKASANALSDDRYLVDKKIKENVFAGMNEELAREELKKIKGVGDKVANCVNLFSLSYRGAFPVDVWIKRIMESMYFKREAAKDEIEKLALDLYGEYGGYAQQYLFFFGRENNLGK